MLEDEQRFEELEAKLAALSSQVEGLELEKEVDPFLEDDVRRLIEDFREKEIEQLEESEDFEDSDEQGSSNDFIDVQTTGGRTFKVHWIAPDSCDNMTKATARAAFSAGAAERYGTSQQVNSGDVLILLCRKPVTDSESSSEPAAPEHHCHYIGMAVNTGLSPTSAEPTATDVESMTSTVGNYEIFVWSSCECSAGTLETAILPFIYASDESSSEGGSYASIGDAASPDMSSADGLLTSAVIRKDNATAPVNLAKGLSDTLTISTNNAGYKTELVQLTRDLTEFYLDRETKDLSFEADKNELFTHNFSGSNYTSKNYSLTSGSCGQIELVSVAGDTLDLGLLQEGTGAFGSNFLTTAKISLGASVSLDDTLAIETFKTETGDLETDNTLQDDQTVFLPIVSDANADLIQSEANLASLLQDHNITIEAHYNVVYEDLGLGDAEYWIYQTKTNQNEISWASGLLTSTGTEETLSRELVGIIRTSDAPLAYGCHPENGCQLDPAGEYYEPSCGGNCAQDELVLTYRPSVIYVYEYDSESNCYNLISEHIRDDGNALNDLVNQYYTQNGRYSAELDAAQEKTENFYKSDVLITEGVRFSPVPDEDICTSLDTVLADFEKFYNGGPTLETDTVEFEKTTADTDIRIRFYPYTIEDKISVWYVKDGVETRILDELTLSTAERDGANDTGGQYIDNGAVDTSGFFWTKTIPAGSVSLTIQIDGTVSGTTITKWNYTVSSV